MGKKLLPFLFTLIYPYCVVMALICLFTGLWMESVFNNDILILILVLGLISFAAFISVIIGSVFRLVKKTPSSDLLQINMVIKLIHIPAYIAIFLFGLLCMLTIFTVGISFVLVIYDVLAILFSGMIGLVGVIQAFREKKLSLGKAVTHGIFQFVFCIDVISSIIVYRKVLKCQSGQTDIT